MNFLNGIEEKAEHQNPSEFWKILPEKVNENLLIEIDKKIEAMQRNYPLLVRRNRLLSAIAILETEINEIENEIKRV